MNDELLTGQRQKNGNAIINAISVHLPPGMEAEMKRQALKRMQERG